ncbi:MAG: uracil-DNA glycosylase [Elusimicrobia bacterium]|nr:uracil-DNA glycosylase [Elusimicrobiota bacterium]
MNRSDYTKTISLIKTYVAEEKDWYGDELSYDAAAKSSVLPVSAADTARADAERVLMKKSSSALEKLRKEICDCVRCPLGKTRINFVFGTGNPRARLMFVGEGPGFSEDHQGEPFIGRAGKMLTKIIEAMGMLRSDVYIANIVKCHPMKDASNPELHGNDRPPTPEEMAFCMPYLERQIECIKPVVICTLGTTASQGLLGVDTVIGKLRGNMVDYKKYKLMPTYHPAALLRNPALKRDLWEDMKQIKKILA